MPGRWLPIRRDLGLADAASLLVGLGIVAASSVALGATRDDLDSDSSLVLVSRGADIANLVIVLPILLGSMWLARRGSLIGLLL